jgi:hypothetical protein
MAREPDEGVPTPDARRPSREDVRERLESLSRRLEEHRNVVSDHVENTRAAKEELAKERPDKGKVMKVLRDISESVKSVDELSTIADDLLEVVPLLA